MSVILPAFTPSLASADTLTPDQELESASYYSALGHCIESTIYGAEGLGTDDIIKTAATNKNVSPGSWWDYDDGFWDLGVDRRAVSVYSASSKKRVESNCTDVAERALEIWGYTGANKYSDFLEGIGCVYDNSAGGWNCHKSNNSARMAAYQKAVKAKGAIDQGNLSDAAKYRWYLSDFIAACGVSSVGTESSVNNEVLELIRNSQSDGRNNYYVAVNLVREVTDVDGTFYLYDSPKTVFSYKVSSPNREVSTAAWTYGLGQINYGNEDISTYYNASGCRSLASSVTPELAEAIIAWNRQNSGSTISDSVDDYIDCEKNPEAEGCGEPTATCGSEVKSVGWLICPVVDGLTALNDSVWSLVSEILTVDPLESSGRLYRAWSVIRNIANALFVIVFLAMIFSQLTNFGIDNYGIKKLLPKLVIGVVLVNLSYIIMQLAVDAANVVGSSLYDLITNIADAPQPKWQALTNLLLGGAVTAVAGAGAMLAVGGIAAAFWLLLPFAIVGALALLAALVTLIIRQALIPILAILAPLAFVAYLLPNTESWFKKWRDGLMSMLMLYPIAAIVFGGSQLAAYLTIGDGEDWWKLMIGLIMLTLPLFSLPFLARQGGAILAKVGGSLQGVVGKAKKPLGGLTKNSADLAREKYLTNPPNRFNLSQKARQRFHRRSLRQALDIAALKSEQETEFGRDVSEGVEKYTGRHREGSAARAYIEGAAARAEDKDLQAAMVPLAREYAEVKATGRDSRGVSHASTDAFLEARATDQTRTNAEKAAAINRLAMEKRDKVLRRLGTNPAVDQRVLREAISRNASALSDKAPDLVKGNVAFDTVTGAELSKFGDATGRAYMTYLQGLHNRATAVGATAADISKFDSVSGSFNSAVQDIAGNTNLQGAFIGETGMSIKNTANSFSPQLQARLTGLNRIRANDGKIR